MRVAFTLAFIGMLAAAAAAQSAAPGTPSPAATPTPPAIVITGWRLECSTDSANTLSCQALDRVSLRANDAVIGALGVRLSADKKTSVLFVQVPLGVAIPNAVRVGTTSGAVQTIAILTCNRNGCFGNARLGDPLLNAMKTAKEPLHLAYESLLADSTTRTITVNLPLTGFAEAYEKLK